jgi:hypothetical protein
VSAATDLVFIIAGRVNIIVIKAGPVVAPVCARITNRPGAMAVFTTVGTTVRRPILADCSTGLITSTKFLLAIIGITAVGPFTLNSIQTTPSQKEREKNKNKKAKGKNFLPHRQRIAKKGEVGKCYFVRQTNQ